MKSANVIWSEAVSGLLMGLLFCALVIVVSVYRQNKVSAAVPHVEPPSASSCQSYSLPDAYQLCMLRVDMLRFRQRGMTCTQSFSGFNCRENEL